MPVIETQIAAFKGVEFLMLSARTSGGRKDALYEFPNSNRQTIEDFGLKVRAYNIVAIIPHENYFDIRDALLQVLESDTAGPLDHPTFGRIENVKARSFIINERITELGRAELQINFAIDDDIGTPQQAINSISQANQTNTDLAEIVNSDIAETFEVDTGLSGNFQNAQALLNDAGDAFNTAVNTANQVADKVNEFSAQINQFVDGINSLIALPQDLANSVTNLFSTINGLYATFEIAVDVYKELFGFGDDDTEIVETTVGLTQRKKNRDVINAAMQTTALSYAYLNAVQVTFQTTDDIDTLNTDLDVQYEKIIANPDYSEEIKRAITDMRTISNKLFDDKRLNTRKIIEIYTYRRPMSEIAYQYYGSTELTDTLLELNNISNGAFVEGTINILTE